MQFPDANGSPNWTPDPQGVATPVPGTREQQQRTLAQGTRPAALSRTPNLIALLVALRRRWLLALTLGLVIGPSAAIAAWAMRPITYMARTLLEVKAARDKILWDLPERNDFNNYQRVQVALVRSRLVLNAALNDPTVQKLPIVLRQDEPVMWLEKEVGADFSIAPEIMRISMIGEDGDSLKVLVDAIRRAYMAEIVQKELRARQARLEQLKKYYADYDTSLKEKRDTLKHMARRIGSKDDKVLGAKQELNDKYLRDLQGRLLKERAELMTAGLELATQEAQKGSAAKTTVPDAMIEQMVKKDTVIARYERTIAENDLILAEFRERSPDPEAENGYKAATHKIDEAKAGIKKRRDAIRPQIIEQLRSNAKDEQQLIYLKLGDRVKFMTEMKNQLEAEIKKYSTEMKGFNDDTVEVSWLNDEIATLETSHKEVNKQIQTLTVEMQAPPRVSEMEEGIVLPAQTEASRLRFAAGAGLGGFAAVLFGIALLEFRLRRVNHVDDITQGLKMKLVGSLPLVPRRALLGRATPNENRQWQTRLTESVDAIRTTLLNAARFDGLRRVMVTSAVGGEGKTLLSCHLAVSLARAGCRTLLLDGDLRRPSVHKLFNLQLGQGLSDLLRGDVEPSAITQGGPLEGLSIITAGQSDSTAVQHLARQRIVDVLQQLGQDYEFVVVDSAPVLPVADAQLIGQHMDGVVFSVMRDVSRLPAVYAAYERLAMLRVRILGAVVSGAEGSHYRSSYYYSAPGSGQASSGTAAKEKAPA
jgi:capsular exopolysaccharide synthesis family protein